MPSPLFSPIRLRGLELPNRVVVAPMSMYSATDGCAGNWHLQHVAQFGLSGAGLFVIEASAVSAEGRSSLRCLGLYDDACEAALARVLEYSRSLGVCAIGIQLGHSGRKAGGRPPWEGRAPLTDAEGRWQGIAPSAIPLAADWAAPRAMGPSDFQRVRDAFVAATRRALRLGIDLVELHAAHGYLLHQFLSPLTNRRDDAYGGSLDARMRFPLEVIAAVRDAWPSDRPLGMRISATDWLDGGFNPDEAVGFVRAAQAIGCDYVCVSTGGLDPAAPVPLREGYQVPFAARIRADTGMVTRTAGLIVHAQHADAIIATGEADQIVLARTMIDDPRWVWHAAEALGVDVAYPKPYERAKARMWPGAALTRPHETAAPSGA